MRSFALWAALLLGAAHSGAQAPLSVDPSFVAPFEMHEVESSGFAQMIRLDDGNFLISGDFNYPLDWWNDYPSGVLAPDGSLIAQSFYGTHIGGGSIRKWNDQLYIGNSNQFVRRLEQDGTWDQSYVHGQGDISLNQGADFVVQPDGGILQVGAISWPVGGGALYGLMRFTNTGSVDTTYQHRLSNGNIYTLRPTTDGRYWCSGVLSEYDGQPVSRFFRIWPNGDLDTTFSSPVLSGYANAVHEQQDGKVILGGSFKVANVGDTLYLIRLMPNGSLDPTFQNERHLEYYEPSMFAFIPYVRAILPLDDSRLLIGGGFWTVDGERRGLLAVVDTAGSLDPVLANYYGCDSVSGGPNDDREVGNVLWMDRLDDGFIYIGGIYTGFNDGTWHPEQRMITRLHPLNVGLQELAAQQPTLVLAPNPGSTLLTVTTDVPGPVDLMLIDAQGRAIKRAVTQGPVVELDVSNLSSGPYVVELHGPGYVPVRAKWIKQ